MRPPERTSEVLNARWDEFALGADLWTIPEERMRAGAADPVPLTPRSVARLTTLQRPHRAFVFEQNKRGQPITNLIGLMQMRRMGLSHFTVHGFRSSCRAWCAECPHSPATSPRWLLPTIENRVKAA